MRELTIHSGVSAIDTLVPRIRGFLEKDIAAYDMFGRPVRGYRSPDSPSIWLRDHSDMLRAGRYWETDLQSALDHFAETQTEKGWLYDFFSMVPEKAPCERENWARYVRVPVEADVEYRFIKGVFLAWQATGDDRWLTARMPQMVKALRYVMTDPWRWDKTHGLVKRAYTIDTWDFDYTAGRHPWLNFRITPETAWGFMHGDLSGYYEAFTLMGRFCTHLRRHAEARRWVRLAARFRSKANSLCFNGRFYTHRVPLTPGGIPGAEEADQLSLSNPMDINRGLATHAIAVSILREYQRRGRRSGAFAEWFSVDPPFPDGVFGDEKLVGGAYCNGGIMPLVGGELARAAFEHGFERYGVDQLLRYEQLTAGNESYLWYFPDGRHATKETSTSPEASPTDGWGSSAMLYALVEGLAGVVDQGALFRHIMLSPRWVAAGSEEAEVHVPYGPSGRAISYRYRHDSLRRRIELEIGGTTVAELRLLMPDGRHGSTLTVNGRRARFVNRIVEGSVYAEATVPVRKRVTVVVEYR
jgi:hypothetical protein